MFEPGMLVMYTFHGLGGYEEIGFRQIVDVENDIVYVSSYEIDAPNFSPDVRSEGITFDQNGIEREGFFPPMYASIVPVV
jgi:hypothetical protein